MSNDSRRAKKTLRRCFLYVDINTNRAVLFPAELKFLRFKFFLQHQYRGSPNFSTFLLVVQLMMQIGFCICNFEHDYLDG